MMMEFTSLLSFVDSLLVLFGCLLFWFMYKNAWALLALAGEGASFLCHVVVALPGTFSDASGLRMDILRFGWPVASLVFAIGLAGLAWSQYEIFRRRAAEGSKP